MKFSLSKQRSELGLRTPSWEAKQLIWARVKSATAGFDNGYTPLGAAARAHKTDSRAVAVSGGWRAGKSLSSAMEGLAWLPYADLIWLVAKDYDLTRQEFTYLAEGGVSTGLVLNEQVHMSLNKYQPCALRSINGCVVETRTLADFRKLAAKPPDLVIVCEPGLIDNLQLIMEILWGRVSERRGRIWLAGTSDEASEEWYELWDGFHQDNPMGTAYSIPTWDNRYRFPKGRRESEFEFYEAQYGREALLAHYGGIPSSPRDMVLRGYWNPAVHIDESLEYTTDLPVEIAIDPNYQVGNRYWVGAIQWNPGSDSISIVDEIAEEGMTHDEIRALCMEKEWWRNTLGGTIDPFAGESHVFGSPAPIEYWSPLDLRCDFRPRVNTTVQALKEAMAPRGDKGPRLHVSPRAERFIWEAPRWRQERTGKPSVRNCDGMKGMGYWLVDHFAVERAHVEEDNIAVRTSNWSFE